MSCVSFAVGGMLISDESLQPLLVCGGSVCSQQCLVVFQGNMGVWPPFISGRCKPIETGNQHGQTTSPHWALTHRQCLLPHRPHSVPPEGSKNALLF